MNRLNHVILLFLICKCLLAKEIHVSKTGMDNNEGTAGKPLKTIQANANTAMPGDVITGWKKLENNTWQVVIPNSFFGNLNPRNDLIRGDWFNPRNRQHHTGAIYLNGDWLMEAAKKERIIGSTDEKNPLWWAEKDETETTI